jgi:hypothetical protein
MEELKWQIKQYYAKTVVKNLYLQKESKLSTLKKDSKTSQLDALIAEEQEKQKEIEDNIFSIELQT